MNAEVLVHVKAPSKFVDDKRYAAIAQSALDFEPVTFVRCNGEQKGEGQVVELSEHKTVSTLQSQATSTALDRKQMTLDASVHTETVWDPANSSGSVRSVRSAYDRTKHVTSRRYLNLRSRSNNPPYRSPIGERSVRKVLGTGALREVVSGTPILQDRTNYTVLVPNTSGLKRKHSEPLSSDCRLNTSFIADSQLTPSNRANAKSWTLQSAPTFQLASYAERREVNTQAVDFPGQRKATINRDPNFDLVGYDGAERPSSSFPPSLQRQPELHHSMRNTPETFIKPKNSLAIIDVMDRHESSVAESDESTLTVSSRSARAAAPHSSAGDIVRATIKPSPIDLCTPEAVVQNTTRLSGRPNVAGPHSFQSIIGTAGSASSDPSSATSHFATIQALPLIIDPPSPTVAQLSAPTHDSPILRAVASGLSLPRRFRPESMIRGVADRERGYWRIPVTLTAVENATAQEGPSSTKLSGRKHQSNSPLFKRSSLTEPEFLTVWDELSKYVSSGKAGWSVRVVRRKFYVAGRNSSNHGEAQLCLQVYCYGEAIPYIYAMLLVCTRMYVLYKPLSWISALNEKAVITMTGDESGKESQMRWTRYLDEQGRGFWRC